MKKTKEKVKAKSPLEENLTQAPHNRMNVMASSIVGDLVNIRNERIKESFTSMESMEHRNEGVRLLNGVTYISDAYATKVNATWFSLDSLEGNVIWIAGGADKSADFGELLELVKNKVKMLVLLSKGSQRLLSAFQNVVPYIEIVHTMEDAVTKAAHFAVEGDTVLLSPACPSFDMYESYQAKGDHFKECVFQLVTAEVEVE